jgi:sugar transferase (PEP-CTERM system associated)
MLELAVLFFSTYAGIVFWAYLAADFSVTSAVPIYPKALLFAAIVFITLGAMGLYQRRFRHGLAGMFLRLAAAFVLAGLGLGAVNYVFPRFSLPLEPLFTVFGVAFLLAGLIRSIFLRAVDQSILKRRVLVLGAGERASQISLNLRRATDQRGFQVVGYVHVRGEHDVVDEDLIIRPDVPLLQLAAELQVDEIVVAVGDRRRKSFPVHELLDCKLSGIDVIDLLQFFEREVGKIKLDILNPSWLIFSDGFDQGDMQSLLKRVFDVITASILLLITWPAMLLVALAIILEEGFRGPIFYKQVRVGQHWQLFSVIKFRSMRVDAEKDGPKWAQKKDSRVTRVGEFIRKVRLDELPQLFNVLKGEMSFVGPRPERPEFVTELSEQIPYFAERHRVKPGITGWAQVCYPYGASERDSLEKLQYDLYYIKNYTVFLDLVIILQTAHEVTFGKGGR